VNRLLEQGITPRNPAAARLVLNREQTATRAAESRPDHVGWGEDTVSDWLVERGETPDLQHPVGTKNIDIAIAPVAVEIWLSSSSPLTDPYCRKRIEYLSNRGWWCCYVLISRRTKVLLPAVADEIITFVQLARVHPTPPRQHRVIRGCGELAATFGDNLNDITVVPPSKGCIHHRTGNKRIPE